MNSIKIAISKIGVLAKGQTSDMANVLTIQNLIYEPLVRLDSGQIYPALAKCWQALDHGRRWIFTLRENARFSDGTPCVADAVAASLESAKNVIDGFGMPGPFAKYLAGLTFSVIAPRTLEILSETPNGDICDFLSEIYIQKENPRGEFPFGTMDYAITDYQENEAIYFKRRLDASGAAAYEEIAFFQMPKAEDRLDALKCGKVDVAMEMENLLNGLPDDRSVNWFQSANTLSVTGFLNGFESPFDDPVARLAINYAVDKKRIIRDVCYGLAIPAATVVSPFHCGFESDIRPLPYDPDRARDLFSHCGAPAKLIIRTPQIIPAHGEQIAGFIKEDLEKIGFSIDIDVQRDRPAYAREASQKKIGHLGLFDSSPHSVYRVLQDKISSRIQSTWWQGTSDTFADKLIDEAHEEVEVCARTRKYAAVLRRLNANPPWLYLFHPICVFACSKEVKEAQITSSGLLRFPGTW